MHVRSVSQGEGAQVISTEQLTNPVANGTGCVVGPAGERIGKVGQVFLDDRTGLPAWVTAKAGLYSAESFIPLARATRNGNVLAVPFAADEIKDAPRVRGEGEHLSQAEAARLRAHYGLNCADIVRTPAACTVTASSSVRAVKRGQETTYSSRDVRHVTFEVDSMSRSAFE
jgi:hypothetical protein